MKKYKDLSVKAKIPIMLGIASIVVFTLVCILLIIPLRRNTLNDSAQVARYAAELAGEQLAVKINASATIMPAHAGVIASLIQTNLVRPEDKRKMMMNDMETLVMSEVTAVTNAWVILEPNVLDGLDSRFINQPGCTAQGVVSARWDLFGTVYSAESDANRSLYRQVKKNMQGMMSQPYQDDFNGQKVWMITAIAPIMHSGNFYGVVATDYDLTDLCVMVNSLNSIGDGKLVTDKGFIVAHSDQESLGILTEYGHREIIDKLADEEEFEGFFTVNDVEMFKVYVPIRLGGNDKLWFYAVDVAPEKIYESAREQVTYLIVYCIIGIFLISIAGFFLILPMLNSVVSVTGIIRQLSLGRINLKIDQKQTMDEIGTMKSELGRLLDGLKHTADFAHNIGEGDLNAEYRLLSNDDVLGNSLLEMRKSLQKAEKEQSLRSKEEEQRNWGTAGLAKFAEILRYDNNNMEALSYNVINNLVKYLGANQGGIFVLNEAEHEEDRFLELKACYAFDRKKFVDKKIHIGEGLVGTCYIEGEPIYLTEIPNTYINITSGLGKANPRAILICPLKVNDQIFGVIELASFREIEPYQIDFVQRVCESIAATISTVNVNIRTGRLLAQTKLQAEEMANQEEELRQNMEEMQATQEEMRRREEDSINREYATTQLYKDLMDLFECFEFSSNGMMESVSPSILEMTGLAENHFVGRTYIQIYPGGEEEGRVIWEKVISGERITSYAKFGDRPVRIVSIPMISKQQQLQKVIVFVLPEISVAFT